MTSNSGSEILVAAALTVRSHFRFHIAIQGPSAMHGQDAASWPWSSPARMTGQPPDRPIGSAPSPTTLTVAVNLRFHDELPDAGSINGGSRKGWPGYRCA